MKSFLVIGIGEYGHAMAVKLSQLGNEVLAADCDETRLSDLLGVVASAKIGDCTRPEVLRSFGAEDFDACIVCIRENFQNSLEITAQLSELGAKQVISLAGSAIHAKFLARNGATQVIFPVEEIAERTAVALSNDRVFDRLELGDGVFVYELSTPKEWIGKSVMKVNVRARYGVTVLAAKRDGRLSPIAGPEYVFNARDHLLVLGGDKEIGALVGQK